MKGQSAGLRLAISGNDRRSVIFVHKASNYGCQIEKIDRFFPSSKRCFHCGFINQDLTLSDRQWICPECSTVLDRDVNAAQNILNWYTAGTAGINADGQNIRPPSEGSLIEVGNSFHDK